MEQIRNLMRPTDVPDTGLLCDLLWADPDKMAFEDFNVGDIVSVLTATGDRAFCAGAGAFWAGATAIPLPL